MKLVKTKVKENKTEIIKVYISEIEHYIMFAYLFCMLGIFPLYYKEQYSKIGTVKFEFFWNTSLYFIGGSLIIFLIKVILQRVFRDTSDKMKITQKAKNPVLKFFEKFSVLDYAVFIYAACVLISYVFSDFKEYAWKGAAGWEMGLCSQMMFVAIYFILSGKKEGFSKRKVNASEKNYGLFPKLMIGIHLIFSALTFLFGILHRFQMDPLGLYEGLDLYYKIRFLSTIGQATWFSSYVCTVCAVGVALFYVSEKKWIRMVTGIYSTISFAVLVTQNSDSAFIAISGIMLLLGYYSLSDIKKWCRFWQIVCLMWGTFAGVGILQKVFADRVIPLDALSIFFSQSTVTWVMFAVSLAIYLFYRNYDKKAKNVDRIMKITRRIYQGILVLLAAAVGIIVIFIYLNTKGVLLERFGYQSTNNYLLFNYQWGNLRGVNWIISWEAFGDLSLFQKLFGVGPDSTSAYLYSIPETSEILANTFGTLRLTNAHNEYLNSLLCYGVVGVTAWLAVLIGGMSYFYKKAKDDPFMIAFALCIMGYACHNIFCYQQVCCTPFLFIALGIGESLTKSENFNTIK